MNCPICGKVILWRPPYHTGYCYCGKSTYIKEIERLNRQLKVEKDANIIHIKRWEEMNK